MMFPIDWQFVCNYIYYVFNLKEVENQFLNAIFWDLEAFKEIKQAPTQQLFILFLNHIPSGILIWLQKKEKTV